MVLFRSAHTRGTSERQGLTGLSLPQSALLDFYVKNILMSKVKPQKYLLVSERWPFLVRLAKSPFKFCGSEPSFILGLLP